MWSFMNSNLSSESLQHEGSTAAIIDAVGNEDEDRNPSIESLWLKQQLKSIEFVPRTASFLVYI